MGCRSRHSELDSSSVPASSDSDERFLAQKTLFMLALALAKWVGSLHALSYRVFHSRGWGEVSSFVAGFVAKTQDPSSSAPRFEGFSVPALPNSSTNRNGRLLCPVPPLKARYFAVVGGLRVAMRG